MLKDLKRAYENSHTYPTLRENVLGTGVELIYVYKQQVRVLYESSRWPLAMFLDQMVESVYLPYRDMWNMLMLEDEQVFRESCTRFREDARETEYPGLRMAIQHDFASQFAEIACGVKRLLGFQPRCHWHLVFAPHSDMGGDRVNMWANLAHFGRSDDSIKDFRFLLPHEFSHIVLPQFWEGREPIAFTLLALCIEEGLSSYFNYEYWCREYSPAKNLLYSDAEWQWCLVHEREILERLTPELAVGDYAQMVKYHRGDEMPWSGPPSRLAYFVGFRICQRYVDVNGKDSWKEIYAQTPENTLRKSLYLEQFGFTSDCIDCEPDC
jgi:Predicted Zn-dependent protease (DUF2268)